MRLNADGSSDASFGVSGKLQLTNSEPGLSALDSLGRLYVVTSPNGTVIRIVGDGTVDSTYDGGGSLTNISRINSIAIDASDRVVLFGEGRVARRDTSGNPDVTFDGDGIVTVALPRPLASSAQNPSCYGVVQSGNQPLIACSIRAESDMSSPRADLALVRFTEAGAEDATFGAGQTAPDSYPDAISFPDATADYGTAWVESAARTLTGFSDPARVVIRSARTEYSIGCTGTFTAVSDVLTPGQSICLRQSAPTQPGASKVASVDIGGRQVTFTVIAGNSPADFVPDQFAFDAQSDVALGATVISNTVTISGITGAATLTVTNGAYSIGCGPDFTGGTTQVTNGTTICVRHNASSTPSTSTTTQLNVGGVIAAFTSTTVSSDTPPAPDDQTGVPPGGGAVATPDVDARRSSGGGGSIDHLLLILLGALALPARLASRRRRAVAT